MKTTIYSNGVASISRKYIAKNKKVSIPIKKEHISDALATFNLVGDISLAKPPTFTPTNVENSKLIINFNESLKDLLVKLVGAKISFNEVTGTILGVQKEYLGVSENPIHQYSLIYQDTNDLVQSIQFYKIANLKFLDQQIQDEINKAVNRNIQNVKPNSTYLDLELTPESKDELEVQYLVPCSPWKMTYRLYEHKNVLRLMGLAVIDNNTEEDWKDCIVSVVSGSPNTFSTDLGEQKNVIREHVESVSKKSLRKSSVQACSFEGATVMGFSKVDTTIVNDQIDDYCSFTSESVNIPANQSSIIPVIKHEIEKWNNVLYYKDGKHPVRAIEFDYNNKFPLPRGVCAVYRNDTCVGQSIFDAIKPSQTQLISYSLDTRYIIDVKKEQLPEQYIAVEVANGVCVYRSSYKTIITYNIRNLSNIKENIQIEYKKSNPNSRIKVENYKFKEEFGKIIIMVPIEENSSVNVIVNEILVDSYNISLNNDFYTNIIEYDNNIVKDTNISKLIDLNNFVIKLGNDIFTEEGIAEQISQSNNGMIEMLKVIKNADIENELLTNHKKISKLRENIIANKNKQQQVQEQIDSLLKEIKFKWVNANVEL